MAGHQPYEVVMFLKAEWDILDLPFPIPEIPPEAYTDHTSENKTAMIPRRSIIIYSGDHSKGQRYEGDDWIMVLIDDNASLNVAQKIVQECSDHHLIFYSEEKMTAEDGRHLLVKVHDVDQVRFVMSKFWAAHLDANTWCFYHKDGAGKGCVKLFLETFERASDLARGDWRKDPTKAVKPQLKASACRLHFLPDEIDWCINWQALARQLEPNNRDFLPEPLAFHVTNAAMEAYNQLVESVQKDRALLNKGRLISYAFADDPEELDEQLKRHELSAHKMQRLSHKVHHITCAMQKMVNPQAVEKISSCKINDAAVEQAFRAHYYFEVARSVELRPYCKSLLLLLYLHGFYCREVADYNYTGKRLRNCKATRNFPSTHPHGQNIPQVGKDKAPKGRGRNGGYAPKSSAPPREPQKDEITNPMEE